MGMATTPAPASLPDGPFRPRVTKPRVKPPLLVIPIPRRRLILAEEVRPSPAELAVQAGATPTNTRLTT